MSRGDMQQIKQNKVKLNATVSKWVKKRADEFAETDEFGSLSNFVELALAYYISALDKKEELKGQEVEKLLKQKQAEYQEATSLLIKFFSANPELLKEINNSPKQNPGLMNYDPQKEKEECLQKLCPNPRELTPEEVRIATEAKKRIRTVLPDNEENEKKSDYPHEYILE